MDKEKYFSLILGLSLLIAGLVVLFFVFSYASGIVDDPQGKLNELTPNAVEGPTASLQWYSVNNTVEFYDFSTKGDAEIVSYNWDFGDGGSSDKISPTHEYDGYGNYTVTLTVEDSNGETDSVKTKVSTQRGVDSGQALKGFDLSVLNLGDNFERIVIVGLLIGGLAILVLIGGKIMFTGARLIRPTSENLKIKSKNGVVLDVTSSDDKKKKTVKKVDEPKAVRKKEENTKEEVKQEKTSDDKEKEMNDFFEGKA
jgi:PKD repeat protein